MLSILNSLIAISTVILPMTCFRVIIIIKWIKVLIYIEGDTMENKGVNSNIM